MASYTSYRKNRIKAENVENGAITNDDLAPDVRNTWCVKWIYGNANCCSPGCCCLWTVPSGVRQVKWEIWGAGGNGSGACSCNRCQHFMGAGGGSYNTRTVTSAPGCQYTVCAGGVYRCFSRECNGCQGCQSYVNGYNLSGFCADGGSRGCANGSWAESCYSYMPYCKHPGNNGGEFANYVHSGSYSTAIYQYPGGVCHCWKNTTYTTGPTHLSVGRIDMGNNFCWIRCGCWMVPYATGGQGAMSTYCGRCCGQGGTGGPGVVKITFF